MTDANHEAVAALFARMPKAELHLHLDGSMRPQTALELARERGLDEGMDLAAIRRRLRAPARVAGQAELLRAFDLPIALMQDRAALKRVTRELVEDVAAEGTRYVEIRWAPALHLSGGLALDDSVAAVADGAATGSQATGTVVRLIAVALRSHPPRTSLAVAHAAARFIDRGVTGFDLAGPEEAFPDPLAHRAAFVAARRAGLGITIHAGEWGGAEQVRRALVLGPARIAHGAPAATDVVLLEALRARSVTLDLCPTSMVQASVFGSPAEFPLARLLHARVPVTLSTDDRTVSDVTLSDEYRRAHETLAVTVQQLWQVNLHALRVAFLQRDEELRNGLLGDFRDFASAEPLLANASSLGG
jgi:adenosine deaminase